MKEPVHRRIIEHYEACLARHGDSFRGVDWPNERDAHTRYSVMLDVVRDDDKPATLLDFGCGASHLFQHLRQSGRHNLMYHGLDASAAFCELSRRKFPQNEYYCLDVLAAPSALPEFDYVVMNGVFTEKRELTYEQMFEYFKQVIRTVYPRVRKGLAFNVMSKAVDWEREDLFHLPTDSLISFLTGEVTRHFVIRNDYGLYEYTTYVYREASHG